MYITNEDLDVLKEGLSGLTSENSRKKRQESLQRINYYHDRMLQSRNTRSRSTKDGRRFSQETSDALDEHIKALRSTARRAQSMSDELAEHAQTLHQKANDLTNLYRSEGQGPAYATD